MATNDYTAALRQGRRSYRAALTKGEYPYLPVLDEIMSYTEVAGMENIGIMDIPLSKIVGTKTVGRSNAFANNFMPLLPEESEFGMKWAAVYKHQIEDGISDPIVAYEFMNQFYVQEGNKRVSVMKYLQTYSIAASVTRLVPKKTDDKENRLYFEFLDFYEVSRSYDVCFTREGSYKKLLKLMGKKEDEVWSDDDRMNLHFACYNFERAFHKEHGENLDINVSDAFLIYVEIYGYDKVKSQSEGEILKALQKMWTEITLADQGSQVELVQNPEQVKATLLNKLISAGVPILQDAGDFQLGLCPRAGPALSGADVRWPDQDDGLRQGGLGGRGGSGDRAGGGGRLRADLYHGNADGKPECALRDPASEGEDIQLFDYDVLFLHLHLLREDV